MKLDLRRPLIVLTGAWNPSIFTWQWVANIAMGIDDGVEIALGQAVYGDQGKAVTYINDVGFHCSENRLEIYVNTFEQRVIDVARDLIVRVVSELKHTPMHSVGFNFTYVEENPDGEVYDILKNNDNIDKYRIVKQRKETTFVFEDNVFLKYDRSVSEDVAVFDFNFHHEDFRENHPDIDYAARLLELDDWCRTFLVGSFDFEVDAPLNHGVQPEGHNA